MNLKSILSPLGLLLVLLVLPQAISAQIEGELKNVNDSAVLTLNLQELTPAEGRHVPKPYWKLFMVFNDGQFYQSKAVTEVLQQAHGFDNDILQGLPGRASVHAKAIYSNEDGDPPPKIVSGNGPTGSVSPRKVEALPDSALIVITPDHSALVPDGRTMMVVSARAPQDTLIPPDFPQRGYLLFFHESPLTIQPAEVGKLSQTESVKEVSGPRAVRAFLEQIPEDGLLPSPLNPKVFDPVALTGFGFANAYDAMRIIQLDSLRQDEERHYFFPMRNVNTHFDSIPEGGMGTASYAAVLLLEPSNFPLPTPTNYEAEGFSKLGLNALLQEGIELVDNQEVLGTLSPEVRAVAFTETAQAIRRSYDPNLIDLYACPCPDTADVAQKVLVRVAFENEGAGPTRAVKVRIPLPDAIDVRTAPAELFTVSPGIETVEIEKQVDSNALVVTFPKLRLAGMAEGLGLDARSGYFSFHVFTVPGTDASALPPVQACIAFLDENAPGESYNEEICTAPGTVQLVSPDMAQQSPLALDCTSCEVATSGLSILGMPLWLFLLLLLIVVLVVLFALYGENWF